MRFALASTVSLLAIFAIATSLPSRAEEGFEMVETVINPYGEKEVNKTDVKRDKMIDGFRERLNNDLYASKLHFQVNSDLRKPSCRADLMIIANTCEHLVFRTI